MRRLLALLLLPLPAVAAELPVRAITLSSAGLARIDRAGALPPGEEITFPAPTADIDDLLKSLVVRDPAGGVLGLRLPAQDLAAEALRGLPLRAEDFATRAGLLSALRGQPVEAGGQSGLIAAASEEAGVLRLTLLTAEGTVTLKVEDGAPIRFTDAALNGRLARAATALAAAGAESQRVVRIGLAAGGTAPREVGVTYVAGAPLWKPSWRLLLPAPGQPGEARVQGWAVVENRSGADWEGVRLSLVSGEAAAFRQALYTPLLVERIALPVRGSGPVAVQADTGAMPVAPAPAPPAARSLALEQPRARMAAPAEPAAPALAVASAGSIAFTLPGPVTLRDGETANLPFLDASLPAERLWWVQDTTARHPLQAARLRNTGTATLPGGLATVYGPDAADYLGDAEIDTLPVGGERIVAFARDRDVLLTSRPERQERATHVALRPGQLRVSYNVEDTVVMAVDPRGARGRLVLDLPARPGATPAFAVAAEGAFGLRHEAMLDGTPQVLRLAFNRPRLAETPLWDTGLGDPALLAWRDVAMDREGRRLPGGPGTLEMLRDLLATLPEATEGRATLASLIEDLANTRALLVRFGTARGTALTAEAALARARAAAEDRTGRAREDARQLLNRASEDAERQGAAADAAWEAWRQSVRTLLARGG